MQNPTPVGRSGYVGAAARSIAARTTSGSSPSGHALSSQKRGKEQISALFEKGVIVPNDAFDAAQRLIASSQPCVTRVSELSRTTCARESSIPRLAVPVKPRLLSLRRSSTCGRRRASRAAKYPATSGSGEASSMSTRRYGGVVHASTLSTQRSRSRTAL